MPIKCTVAAYWKQHPLLFGSNNIWESIHWFKNMQWQRKVNYIPCFLKNRIPNRWEITSTNLWSNTDNIWISIHCLLNVQWQHMKNHPLLFERRQWQDAENHIHCWGKQQWHHLWNSIYCLLKMQRQRNKIYINYFLKEVGENMWKIISTAKWSSSDNI